MQASSCKMHLMHRLIALLSKELETKSAGLLRTCRVPLRRRLDGRTLYMANPWMYKIRFVCYTACLCQLCDDLPLAGGRYARKLRLMLIFTPEPSEPCLMPLC